MSGTTSELTVRALRLGAGLAVALFVAAMGLNLAGLGDAADVAAQLGIVAIIATPPISLVATAIESWARDRPAAWLALAVIGVLAVAVGVAVIIGR